MHHDRDAQSSGCGWVLYKAVVAYIQPLLECLTRTLYDNFLIHHIVSLYLTWYTLVNQGIMAISSTGYPFQETKIKEPIMSRLCTCVSLGYT